MSATAGPRPAELVRRDGAVRRVDPVAFHPSPALFARPSLTRCTEPGKAGERRDLRAYGRLYPAQRND